MIRPALPVFLKTWRAPAPAGKAKVIRTIRLRNFRASAKLFEACLDNFTRHLKIGLAIFAALKLVTLLYPVWKFPFLLPFVILFACATVLAFQRKLKKLAARANKHR